MLIGGEETRREALLDERAVDAEHRIEIINKMRAAQGDEDVLQSLTRTGSGGTNLLSEMLVLILNLRQGEFVTGRNRSITFSITLQLKEFLKFIIRGAFPFQPVDPLLANNFYGLILFLMFKNEFTSKEDQECLRCALETGWNPYVGLYLEKNLIQSWLPGLRVPSLRHDNICMSKNDLEKVVDLELYPIVKHEKRPSRNFYFSQELFSCSRECSTNCPDQMKPFEVGENNNGMRVLMIMENQIGQGGSSHVFKGKLHEEEIAAKYMDVTESYTKVLNQFQHDKQASSIGVMLENISGMSSEALNQKEFKHKNILPVLEYWFQFKDLKKVFFVISTPLCKTTLRAWVETNWKFPKLMDLLKQVVSGLEHLLSKNYVHQDIKKSNILIDFKGNAKIADFGLNGVTPIYCAPETLQRKTRSDGKIGNGNVEKTDIHGLGVTILTSLFNEKDAIFLLREPIKYAKVTDASRTHMTAAQIVNSLHLWYKD